MYIQTTIIKKSRKSHICDWCGQPISTGESYTRDVWKYDGDFQMEKFHLVCRDAIQRDYQKYKRFCLGYPDEYTFEPRCQPYGLTHDEAKLAETLWDD